MYIKFSVNYYSGRLFNMGWQVHSCELGELNGGVDTTDILVVECKCWNVGRL